MARRLAIAGNSIPVQVCRLNGLTVSEHESVEDAKAAYPREAWYRVTGQGWATHLTQPAVRALKVPTSALQMMGPVPQP